jgi:hypothetical protein
LNSPNIVVLNRARTTFQRISDAKFFNGWIRNVTLDNVVAHTCTNSQLEPGDEFSFQVYGNKKDAFFHARLVTLHSSEQTPLFNTDRAGGFHALDIGCHITTEMSLKDSNGQPRFFVEGVSADIVRGDGYEAEAAVVIDIGPGGFAAIVPRGFKKMDSVRVTLRTNGQMVQFEAEVRNCVVNALNSMYERIGLQIQRMDRVDALRWKQLYSALLDGNRMQGPLSSADAGNVKRVSKDSGF